MTKWNRLLAAFVAVVMMLTMPIMTGVSRAIAEDAVPEDGTLTITKTNVDGDQDDEFNFTMDLTIDPATTPISIQTLTDWIDNFLKDGGQLFSDEEKNAILQKITNYLLSHEAGELLELEMHFTLKGGETATIEDLGGGTAYEITEEGTEGYTPSVNGTQGRAGHDITVSGVIDGDTTVAFTNTYIGLPGTLTITKTNVNGDPDDEFNYTMTLTIDPSLSQLSISTVTDWIDKFLKDGGQLFTDEEKTRIIQALIDYLLQQGGENESMDPIVVEAHFTLKGGETATILDLEGGIAYEITEEGKEGYTPSVNGTQGRAGHDITVSGVIDGDTTVAFTNTYIGLPGTLTITKTNVNGDPDDEFNYTMTLTIDPSLSQLSISTVTDWIDKFLKDGGQLFTDEEKTRVIEALINYLLQQGGENESMEPIVVEAHFTLKGGETATILDLDGGIAYEITEEGTAGYIPSVNGETGAIGSSITASGVIDGDTTVAFTNTFDDYPMFKTQSLVLDGKIGVRFYMYLPQIERFGYEYMDFQIDGKSGENYATTEQFSTDPAIIPVNSKGYYGFTFYVNSIQMADTITATFHFTDNGSEATIQKTFTAKEYFLLFDESYAAVPEAYTENMATLIKATADLGHYVQAYLSDVRPEWSIENGDHAEMDKFYNTYDEDDLADTVDAVADYALTLSGSNDDFKKIGYKVNFDSDMAIHLIVVLRSGFSGTLTATTEDGVECVITQQTGLKYMVEIPNVQAHLLSHTYTLNLTTENGTLTLKCSGLSYAKMMLDTANGDALMQNAAIALYRYSKAADAVKNDR